MLSFYHRVTSRRTGTLQEKSQIQQCCQIDYRLLAAAYSTTGIWFKHPLRDLGELGFLLLLETAAMHGSSTLYQCSVNPDGPSKPRMPRITELPRFGIMGICSSICINGRVRT